MGFPLDTLVACGALSRHRPGDDASHGSKNMRRACVTELAVGEIWPTVLQHVLAASYKTLIMVRHKR